MARAFVSSFLVPLVRGGRLHVGRPLGPRAVERLARGLGVAAASTRALAPVDEPSRALAEGRSAVASLFLRDASMPALDEATLRLGAALHDLLALAHPDLGGPGAARRAERIAAAALALAELGPPADEGETVRRHSLLARMPEIARSDRTVTFWLGRQSYVGRMPPARVTALPALRRVRVDVVRRAWMRDIGVPAVARDAVLALAVASPLGEALDPLRLEPPLSWSRILPVLRSARLGRIVAGRLLEVGVARAGDGLGSALFRFASFQDPPGGAAATPETVAFALRFLAHLVWLDVLFGAANAAEPATDAGALASLLTVAAGRAPSLVWPRDVAADGELGRAFAARLERFAAATRAAGTSAVEAARGVVAFAAKLPEKIPDMMSADHVRE
jgi:hypothetical protein